jgi:hypothetical protein
MEFQALAGSGYQVLDPGPDGGYLSPNDEGVDQYTVKLNLSKPQVGVPEHMFHNPAAILSRTLTVTG